MTTLSLIIISFLIGIISAAVWIYSFMAVLIERGYFKIEKSDKNEDPKIIMDSELEESRKMEKTLAQG